MFSGAIGSGNYTFNDIGGLNAIGRKGDGLGCTDDGCSDIPAISKTYRTTVGIDSRAGTAKGAVGGYASIGGDVGFLGEGWRCFIDHDGNAFGITGTIAVSGRCSA